jgi:hypothetical protein
LDTCCFADWQSATLRKLERLGSTQPSAGCQPATQQTDSLRYEPNVRAGRPYFVMEMVKEKTVPKHP